MDCNAGPASDKQGFAALVSELRTEFTPRGWLLSSAVSPSKTVIDNAYDVPSLSRDFDWIGVMTYDYHGHWDKKTGHVAPLSVHSEADVVYFNTNYTLNYWIKLGADPAKLILGVPLYGQSFTLENPNNNGLNAPAKGTGQAGEFTRQAGFLAYYEVRLVALRLRVFNQFCLSIQMVNRFANKSRIVDGQLCKILRRPWDRTPIAVTNGFHLMMWT